MKLDPQISVYTTSGTFQYSPHSNSADETSGQTDVCDLSYVLSLCTKRT